MLQLRDSIGRNLPRRGKPRVRSIRQAENNGQNPKRATKAVADEFFVGRNAELSCDDRKNAISLQGRNRSRTRLKPISALKLFHFYVGVQNYLTIFFRDWDADFGFGRWRNVTLCRRTEPKDAPKNEKDSFWTAYRIL